MFVSVIVCTYRRPDDVVRLLGCLAQQTCRDFEVIVVDADCGDPAVRAAVAPIAAAGAGGAVRLLRAPVGLTRQRNHGLRAARGECVCFLDDDVSVAPTFIDQIRALFAAPDMDDVGGVTGYDVLHYPDAVTWRWRLRCWIGTVPSLDPGAADRLGRNVPHGFAPPSRGCRNVGWLSGFCMIYRRAAIDGLWFDEELPTYGGEDRDFSLAVGRRWRLVLCGDLRVQHHGSPGARVSPVRRVFETGFGTGRGFAKRRAGWQDTLRIGHYVGGEFLLDLASFAVRPSADRLGMAFARPRGIAAGLRSWRERRSADPGGGGA